MNKKFGRLLRVVLRVILALLLLLTSIPAWQGNMWENSMPFTLQMLGAFIYGTSIAAIVIVASLALGYIVMFIVTGNYKIKL